MSSVQPPECSVCGSAGELTERGVCTSVFDCVGRVADTKRDPDGLEKWWDG